jgi:aminoglycoside phosphotransferase (APT) family kinase protein
VGISGAPEAARWVRPEPRRTLTATALERMVKAAIPDSAVLEVQPLTGGYRNSNFAVRLGSTPDRFVLRIYEHDPSLCQKEIDLMHLVGGSVPVPEIIHAEPLGVDELPPFAFVRFVEGVTFRELRRSGDTEAIAQAAHSIGETLAEIGRITFPKSGWLGPGPTVTAPLLEGADPMPRFVDLCLASANLQARMTEELRGRTHELVRAWAPRLASLDAEARLVHSDFGTRNLMVRCIGGRWSLTAVLDWEFAISSTPLVDLANFLRYERASRPLAEPAFSNGYLQAGGTLPADWRRIARIVDLTALCEILTRDDLPDTVVPEIVELVRATVEDRDPQFIWTIG